MQNAERTQILVHLIRSSIVPISKLELSTAESTAYITKPKMRTLRDIYKVAKEDEKRRMLGDGECNHLWEEDLLLTNCSSVGPCCERPCFSSSPFDDHCENVNSRRDGAADERRGYGTGTKTTVQCNDRKWRHRSASRLGITMRDTSVSYALGFCYGPPPEDRVDW